MLHLEKELVIKIIETEVHNIVHNEELCKSQKMKRLYGLGLDISDIAKMLGVRYNFVYNVISEYVKRGSEVACTVVVETKKDKIVELFKQGKSNREISNAIGANYNYVYKVVKELKNKLNINLGGI